jgi:hypothetical protein
MTEGMTHVHTYERFCTCGIAATEPDESCRVHGTGDWPRRCDECGQFIRLNLASEASE